MHICEYVELFGVHTKSNDAINFIHYCTVLMCEMLDKLYQFTRVDGKYYISWKWK